MSNRPSITVVTVVINGEKYIEDTILSVINQTYANLEYIIIDGGSTDGTVEIIRRYENKIDYWLSEKDEGIYYAMNKGIDAATGDWIIFINSGDTLYANLVLENVMKYCSADQDVIFGQYLVKYKSGAVRKVFPRRMDDMWKGIMVTSHQAIFIDTNIMKNFHFNCEFKLAADHDLVTKLYLSGCRFHIVTEIITVISDGGISDVRRWDVYSECSKIAKLYFPQKPYRSYFFIKRLDSVIRMLIKKVLSKSIIEWFQIKKGAWTG